MKANPTSPIVWRPMTPYLKVGSPLVAEGGGGRWRARLGIAHVHAQRRAGCLD
jgi:hypothetical protein